MNTNSLLFTISALLISNFFFLSSYNMQKEKTVKANRSSVESYKETRDLERENAILKAEIVILQRADKDNRLDELERIRMLPSWELRP